MVNSKLKIKINLEDIILYGVIYCFILYAFEAPIRFYTNRIGFGWFIYTKDLTLLVLALGLLLRKSEKIYVNKIVIIFFSILIFYGAVALLNGIAIKQVLFGFKIYLIFFIGIQSYRFFHLLSGGFLKAMNWLAFFSCIGLILNIFYFFPWEGAGMDLGGMEVYTSRTSFAAGGFKRLAGFGRNWSNPAYFALVASALNYSFLKTWRRRDVLLIFIFFFGILISTNKGAIITFLLITIFNLTKRRIPTFFLKFGLILILFLIVILPLLSWNELLVVENKSIIYNVLFSSFEERVENVWPQGLDLIIDHGTIIFGRGIGGIGASQINFEPLNYHPGDNLFVYLYGLIGVLSFGVLVFLGIKIGALSIKESKENYFVSLMVICFLGIGIIGTALENSILNFFFGLMFASLYHQKIKKT